MNRTQIEKVIADSIPYDLSKPIAPAAALGTARGIIREMEEPQPQDVLTCEDYDPDQYEPLTLITVEQGDHIRTLDVGA